MNMSGDTGITENSSMDISTHIQTELGTDPLIKQLHYFKREGTGSCRRKWGQGYVCIYLGYTLVWGQNFFVNRLAVFK